MRKTFDNKRVIDNMVTQNFNWLFETWEYNETQMLWTYKASHEKQKQGKKCNQPVTSIKKLLFVKPSASGLEDGTADKLTTLQSSIMQGLSVNLLFKASIIVDMNLLRDELNETSLPFNPSGWFSLALLRLTPSLK